MLIDIIIYCYCVFRVLKISGPKFNFRFSVNCDESNIKSDPTHESGENEDEGEGSSSSSNNHGASGAKRSATNAHLE